MELFNENEQKEIDKVPEELRQVAMINLLEEMKISRPRLEATLVALLWHIYKGDDAKVIMYLSELEVREMMLNEDQDK